MKKLFENPMREFDCKCYDMLEQMPPKPKYAIIEGDQSKSIQYLEMISGISICTLGVGLAYLFGMSFFLIR